MRAVDSDDYFLARSSRSARQENLFSLDFRLRRKSHLCWRRSLYGSEFDNIPETSKLPN